MKTLLFCLALCLPALLHARPGKHDTKELLARYALNHPNNGEDDAECQVMEDSNEEVGPLNAIVNRRLLWTNNILYYDIADPTYTEDQIARIRAGVSEIETLTAVNGRRCLTFRESSSQRNRVSVVDCGGGCSSYVGMIGGSQRMCLSAGCVRRHGTIMHEFLHALGFHHEHMRADRDDYVYVNFENIRRGAEGNYRKLVEGVSVDHLGTAYDYGSVLHYSAYGFAVDRSIPTIVPLDPTAEIGQRTRLSASDIERVQILYGCKSAEESTYFKHLAGKI